MNVDETREAIHKLKQRFVRDISKIGNQSDVKIEISLTQRTENVFFRDGERPPFDLSVKESPENTISTTPCIFGC